MNVAGGTFDYHILDTFILRKYEREKHFDSLKNAVRLIIYTLLLNPEGEVLRNESWGVDKLCFSVEQILSHGFSGSHIWELIVNKNGIGIELIESQLTSPTSKARAWIRHSLNNKHLGGFVNSLIEDAPSLVKFYDSNALLRSNDYIPLMGPLLQALDGVSFNLNIVELGGILEIPLDVLEESFSTEHLPSPLPLSYSSTSFSSSSSISSGVHNLQAAMNHIPKINLNNNNNKFITSNYNYNNNNNSNNSSTYTIPPPSEDFTLFNEWLANEHNNNNEDNNFSLLNPIPTSQTTSQSSSPPKYSFSSPQFSSTSNPNIDSPSPSPPSSSLNLSSPSVSSVVPSYSASNEDLEIKKLLADFVNIPADLESEIEPSPSETKTENEPLSSEFSSSPESTQQQKQQQKIEQPLSFSSSSSLSPSPMVSNQLSNYSLPKISKKKKPRRKTVIASIAAPSSSSAFVPSHVSSSSSSSSSSTSRNDVLSNSEGEKE